AHALGVIAAGPGRAPRTLSVISKLFRRSRRAMCSLRRQLVKRGIDLVQLPQPAIDLAVELEVEARAGGALRDQADQLVDALELVDQLLHPARALVAVADPALQDVAA